MPGSIEQRLCRELVTELNYLNQFERAGRDGVSSYHNGRQYRLETGISVLDHFIRSKTVVDAQGRQVSSSSSLNVLKSLLKNVRPQTELQLRQLKIAKDLVRQYLNDMDTRPSRCEELQANIIDVAKYYIYRDIKGILQDQNIAFITSPDFLSNPANQLHIEQIARNYHTDVETLKNNAAQLEKFRFDGGLCYGLTYSKVQAELVNDSDSLDERLRWLKRNSQVEGWTLWGQKYQDLGAALEDAHKRYNRLGKPAMEQLQKIDPDTYRLLELRPFIEQILIYMNPEETALRKLIPSQNAVASSAFVYPLQSASIKQTETKTLRTTLAGLDNFIYNLAQTCSRKPGIFTISSGDHIISIKLDKHTIEIFDQNYTGPFSRVYSLSDLQHISKDLATRLEPVNGNKYTLLAITECFSSEDFEVDAKARDRSLEGICNDIERSYPVNVNAANSRGITQLFLASQEGGYKKVEQLIASGAAVDTSDVDGATPLIVAAQEGHYRAVRALVKSGANMALAMSNEVTPLYMASQNNHLKVMAELIKAGVNLDQPVGGVTAMSIACNNGNIEAVKLLLKNNANVSPNDIKIAEQNNHGEIVALLQQPYDQDQIRLNNACSKGDTVKVSSILNATSVDLEWADQDGMTPLLAACSSGNPRLVEMLLGYGVNPDQTKPSGASPLLIASQHGYDQVVDKLLNMGADPLLATKDGVTPLMVAAHNGKLETVKLLISHGVQVTPRAIQFAERRGHVEIIELLKLHLPSGSSKPANKPRFVSTITVR